jgi:3-dehydroquinate synthase
MLSEHDSRRIAQTVHAYGPLPDARDLNVDHLLARLGRDKKTLQGKVHFVLPTRIGDVEVTPGIEPELIRQATAAALRSHS